jgi:hypothetical protein
MLYTDSMHFFHRAATTCIFLLALFISAVTSRQPLATPAFADYASYECRTISNSSENSGPTFRALTASSQKAVELADALCAAPTIGNHYARVVVEWRPRGYLSARHVVEQQYELFLDRRYHILGLVPDFRQYYSPLLDLPSYPVYWVSRTSTPELTQNYFANKTVGLLTDFYSQSFYLLPMKSLQEAGLNLEESQMRFYSDISTLYSAFADGEVDLITSPDIKSWRVDSDKAHRLLIDDAATPHTWFISQNLNHHLACDINLVVRNTSSFTAEIGTFQSDHSSCL